MISDRVKWMSKQVRMKFVYNKDAWEPFFLNQAHADLQPARAWFLKNDPVQIISMHVCECVCVCVRARGY